MKIRGIAKLCVKYLMRGVAFIAIWVLAIFFLLDMARFFGLEKIPEVDTIETTVITDLLLDGKLELLYDKASGFYWLLYTKPGARKSRMVWWVGTINADIGVEVTGKNEVQITYDWFEDEFHKSIKHDVITLNMDKRQTKNVTYIRRLLESWR